MIVYLSGPIRDCTDEEAKAWRTRVKEEFNTIDPMLRDYRGMEHIVDPKVVVWKDHEDILKCDVLLANRWKPSDGTPMEIMFAAINGKKVLVVAPGTVSPWIRFYADKVFPTLDEALDLLRKSQ